MTLVDDCAAGFRPETRVQGRRLFAAGLVRLVARSRTVVEGRVGGRHTARAILYEGTILTQCTCSPGRGAACEHLWATLLAASGRDPLWGAAPCWEEVVEAWRQRVSLAVTPRTVHPPRRVLYVLRAGPARVAADLEVSVGWEEQVEGGGWRRLRVSGLEPWEADQLAGEEDREILRALIGARRSTEEYVRRAIYSFRLGGPQQGSLVPRMCATGRACLEWSREADDLVPLEWDGAGPWQFRLEIRRDRDAYEAGGVLVRGEERLRVEEADLARERLLVLRGRVAPLDAGDGFGWVLALAEHGPVRVPAEDGPLLVGRIHSAAATPPLDLPPELRFEERPAVPQPHVLFRAPGAPLDCLLALASFRYGEVSVPWRERSAFAVEPQQRLLARRDHEAEAAAVRRLRQAGLKPSRDPGGDFELRPDQLPRTVPRLAAAGWQVEAQGRLYRGTGAFRIQVVSGIDWLELHASVDFGGVSATVQQMLDALRRKEPIVRLGDGTFGVLPEDWLRRFADVVSMGRDAGDHLVFRRSQALLLDALLASRPEASWDEAFERLRAELRCFEGITPEDPPPAFRGRLRTYQREGLGWFSFLRRLGLGGCLADDMGLGKTVQVLALLADRRAARREGRAGAPSCPSLVVAPRSLVFNWKEEAARLAPELSLLDHSGPDRLREARRLVGAEADVVLTTYGTLRRDVALLRQVPFDYVVLDEAQAIKNSLTDAAKACRLLRADHRLALSGTPVENHLGELWSLFEFLNPGLLGRAEVLQRAVSGPEPAAAHALLARALRPFILRRTKAQVASHLPARIDQTIHCELEKPQRDLYEHVRRHYRQALLERARGEPGGHLVLVLEALLRLRQVACHPGLVDPARRQQPSAKLEALASQLAEVLDEGHKALVFSQFTSLLALVRERLDRDGVPHEYLDGRTRDRAARVRRFQEDPSCRLFLVSLKAGGLGLNLTAAEYVFLLDPWWNPAVEAQAIDRAHRLGQDRAVFAYRLIARDTVEERVLELQERKRGIAEAIVGEDNARVGQLSREDLELLLA